MAEWRNRGMAELRNGWRICGMAEWRNGEMEEWRNGIMAEWQNGGMAELRNGGIAESRNGGMAEWWNGEWNGKLWYGGQIILFTISQIDNILFTEHGDEQIRQNSCCESHCFLK